MSIGLAVDGFEWMTWDDVWPRHFKSGDCEGWCGATMIVVVTRAFTRGEDLLFQWLELQDKCELYGVHHMQDGRDLIVFERLHVTQSAEDARREHVDHLQALLNKHSVFS